MKRKASALISTISAERHKEERLQIYSPKNQIAIEMHNCGGEQNVHHKNIESCSTSKPKEKEQNPKFLGVLNGAVETQMAVEVYTGGGEPIACRRRRMPTEKIHNGPNPPPGIPNEFRKLVEKMGGSDLQLIIQKGLSKTDMSRDHNRLSLPSKQWIADQGLSSELLRMFEFENGICITKNNVLVPLIDSEMRVWESVSLRRWNMTKAMIVIAGVWNDVADANNLKVKDVVQIWCFKFIETGRLGLVMLKIECDDISNETSTLHSQFAMSSNVPAPRIQPNASNSAGSSTGSHQYQPTFYFDFMTVQVADSEPSDSGSSNRYGGSSTEAVSMSITDMSTSDLDLSLHL